MDKIKLQYQDVANICRNTKELSFLKGDEALQFYRDRVKMEDEFRAETVMLQDLNAKKQGIFQKIDALEGKEKDIPPKYTTELESINIDIERVQLTEKEIEVNLIPFSKFKEAKKDELKFITVFGKIITEE